MKKTIKFTPGPSAQFAAYSAPNCKRYGLRKVKAPNGEIVTALRCIETNKQKVR